MSRLYWWRGGEETDCSALWCHGFLFLIPSPSSDCVSSSWEVATTTTSQESSTISPASTYQSRHGDIASAASRGYCHELWEYAGGGTRTTEPQQSQLAGQTEGKGGKADREGNMNTETERTIAIQQRTIIGLYFIYILELQYLFKIINKIVQCILTSSDHKHYIFS